MKNIEDINFYFNQFNTEVMWFTFNSYFKTEQEAKAYSEFRDNSEIEKIEKEIVSEKETKNIKKGK
jgi:hypothetical protein